MNYSDLVKTLADYLVPLSLQTAGVPTDPDFVIALPEAIGYANNRICRQVDFLEFSTAQSGPAMVVGNRNVDISALVPELVVVEQINVITPPGMAPDSGTRNPLTPIAKPYLDLVYNSSASPGMPKYFSMLNTGSLIVGPFPDMAYGVEVFGTYRPAPISAGTTTTWICDHLPEAFVAACMVRLSGWRKSYDVPGADDPQGAGYWEGQYTKAMDGIDMEESRKSWQAASWSSQQPARASTPPRR
jgi:hypothetical protein